MNKLRILSFDPARACGFAYGEGKVDKYGVFISDKVGYEYVVADIKSQIADLIDSYKPALVTIEEVHYNPRTGSRVFGLLKQLQGVLINYFVENEILFVIIKPSEWQNNFDVTGKNKKKQLFELAKIEFDDSEMDSNAGDAIRMLQYTIDKIEVIQEETLDTTQ